MTTPRSLSVAALAVLFPLAVFAQDLPTEQVGVSNVTGIRAGVSEDGKVTVQWDAAEGDVKKYRIFYSHASILEQSGTYDDYEDAPGTATEYTLANVPPVATLYVSVLAVSQNDVESPYFVEEATVDLKKVVPTQTVDISSSVAPFAPSPMVAMESSTLQLLTAVSTTSTGVVLAFTHPLSIPEQYKEQAFSIKSGSGISLHVVRYRLDGTYAVLDTGLQVPGRVYQVMVHGSIAGKTQGDQLVPQESGTAPLLFTGLLTDLSVPDVQNLTLTPKGKDVDVTWLLPSATIRELQVQQSTNGGRTYGVAVRMEKSAKGVMIPNVTAKQLTVLVRVVGADGAISRGVSQTVSIDGSVVQSSSAASKPMPSSMKPTVSSKPSTPTPITKPGTLPNSGLGLAVIATLSGAATGMRFFRTKNAPKA